MMHGHAHAAGTRLLPSLLALLLAVVPLASCGTQSHIDAPEVTDAAADPLADADAADDDAQAALGRDEGDAALDRWSDECLDRRGDVTAYAVAELKGGQLCALLQQQDYVWSERSQMWVKEDGSAAVMVRDAAGKPLPADTVVTLDAGAAEARASYRIVTSGYSSAKKAFEGLAGKIMTCEDSRLLDDSVVAVASGPSGLRCLVFVNKSHDVYVASVFGEEALAAGLFDRETGQQLGTSVDEVFQALAGRLPGVTEP